MREDDPIKQINDAVNKIDASNGVDAEEIAAVVDAGVAAAKAFHPSLSNHAITELRKLLVPIVTALIGLAAGGGVGVWRGDAAARKEWRQVDAAREAVNHLIQTKYLDDLDGLEPESLVNAYFAEASHADVSSATVQEIALEQIKQIKSVRMPRMPEGE